MSGTEYLVLKPNSTLEIIVTNSFGQQVRHETYAKIHVNSELGTMTGTHQVHLDSGSNISRQSVKTIVENLEVNGNDVLVPLQETFEVGKEKYTRRYELI